MIDFSALGVRDYILTAVVLVGGYIVVSLLPLLRIGRKTRQSSAPVRSDDERPAQSETSEEIRHRDLQYEAPDVQAQALPVDSDDDSSPVFSRELAYSSQDLEVKRLRRDVAELQAEMARMAEEIRRVKATRNVSPIYSEAMILAQQGVVPAEIAAQCGISIGEAELVAALARGGIGAESHGRHGDQ